MVHILPDLRADFEKICYEISASSRRLMNMARRFREHARQMGLNVHLDPITIKYSMAFVQLRMTMANMRSKELKEVPDWFRDTRN